VGLGLQYRAVVKFDSNSNFNRIQIIFKFIQTLTAPKKVFFRLKKFEIKYGCEGFEESNNFLKMNFFRFKMSFELKIWEVKVYF
jgi:hypothetical protein